MPRRSGLLLGLVMVLGVPALGQAQLFPNLPIRRERPDCSQENPQYRMIRQEYWGHYPTCWRKFPPGWGCPSPEAPDWEASKQKIKLVPPETGNGANAGQDQPPANDQPGAEQPDAVNPRPNPAKPADIGLPPIPEGGASPFEPSTAPKPPAGANPVPPIDRPTAPVDAPPPADAPKTSGVSGPPPLGDMPASASAAAPSRRGRMIAGLFSGRRR